MGWAEILMLVGMVGGGVFFVARMSGAIDNLTEAIKDLRVEIADERKKREDHERRIAALEMED